jgi:carnitine-CoA ligase
VFGGRSSELGEDDIWCRAHLAAIKVPRYVVFVGTLPHTPTHRVAKFKLRDDPSLKARAVDLQAIVK